MAKRKNKTYRKKSGVVYLVLTGVIVLLAIGVGINSLFRLTSCYPTTSDLKDDWQSYFGQSADLSDVDAPSLFTGEEDELTVSYLDVGQGDAILLRQNETTMLIDTGDNGQEEKLKSQLDELGVSEIDLLVCTHLHADHIGGAAEIVQAYTVGKALLPSGSSTTQTYEDLLDALDERGVQVSYPKAGYSGSIGEAMYQIIGPKTENADNQNNNSLVIRVTLGKAAFLFTGDAETDEEWDIMATGYDLSADVLKVGHHGSSTSTSERFLQAVSPTCAVISCGADNDYGHPTQQTLDRLADAGVTTYRTDQSGTITAVTDGTTIRIYIGQTQKESFAASSVSSGSGQTTSAQSADGQTLSYIGNRNSKVFHLSTCSNLPSAANQVAFSSREDALAQGYTACSNCNP